MSGSHEDYAREHEVEGSSNRSFGLVMAAACAFFAFSPKFKGLDPRYWLLAPSGAFGLAGLAFPKILTPLNFLWTKLGLLLGKITTPIVLFVFFYVVLTPIALLMRLAGKDPMRSKRAAPGKSYWIERSPPGPAPESLRRQF